MITAMVQFTLPEALDRGQGREAFWATAPRYRAVEGLVRKYYLLSEDGLTAAGSTCGGHGRMGSASTTGVAEFIAQRYGSQPVVTWFETPVIVDNLSGEIWGDAMDS